MPRRKRTNWPLFFGVGVFLLVVGHYISWPMLEHAMGSDPGIPDKFGLPPDPGEASRERAMTAIASIWFFVLGASIGSFLNVVAYRMPMGLTFVSKPSRCPYCETPIQFQHNVPILGWLILRGRCHTCRLPISMRYILVELVVGFFFFTLFVAELASGGRNLPIREPNFRSGVMWNLFTPQYDLIGIYAFHVFLIAVLATIALIKFDKLRIPRRLACFAVVMGITLRAIWPHIGVLPLPRFLPQTPLPTELLRIAFDVIVGLGCGLILQTVISYTPKLVRRKTSASFGPSMLVITLVTTYLGWQAAVPAILIGAFWHFALTLAGRGWSFSTRHLWGISWLIGTWLTLCFWRQLPQVWLPGAESSMSIQLSGMALAVATVFVAESVSPNTAA